ncbi:MAG: FAD-binding protein, partial [Chloroflexi bacterium]
MTSVMSLRNTAAGEFHEAVVIGAGHAGLGAAAMLLQEKVDTIVLERSDCVGSSWRSRYHGLHL